jgi:hypothetical protein
MTKPVRLGQINEGSPRASWVNGHNLSTEKLQENLVKIKSLLEIQLKEQKKELQRYQSAMGSLKK